MLSFLGFSTGPVSTIGQSLHLAVRIPGVGLDVLTTL